MKLETVIRLEVTERADGTVYVSSPDLPLFHVLAPDKESAPEFAIRVLGEYMEMNARQPVALRPAATVDSFFERASQPPAVIPAHIIAEMTA